MTEDDPFDDLDRVLRERGPDAALGLLVERLEGRDEPRPLLDALLLKARHELGIGPLPPASLTGLPEPGRSRYEERYVEALRAVGRRLLDRGEIAAAWPYFKAIGEPAAVAEAIEAYRPAAGQADETLGQVVEIAFNQGAAPGRGFALILDHYGACSAITAFEHLPGDEAVRREAAGRLIAHLHDHLEAGLRAEIARRGQPAPPEGASLPAIMAGRDWLFHDDAYHVDVSHLAAVVRMATIATDPAVLGRAVGLAEYGRRLSDRHRYEGEPPFEATYEDHSSYLGALLGRDVEAAIARFRAKLPAPDPDGDGDPRPAAALVDLLARLGRLDEAIDVAATHLAALPEGALGCPGLAQLCERANRPARLAEAARARGDLVGYAAARLLAAGGSERGAGVP